MKKIKNEKIFVRFCSLDRLKNIEVADLGRQQFFDDQSLGIKPEFPDPYYEKLTYGKRQFDYLSTEYRDLYKNKEWHGFYQLWKDWKGERWLLPHLLKWFKKETGRDLPTWINNEGNIRVEVVNE